jgi:hypothetical protein
MPAANPARGNAKSSEGQTMSTHANEVDILLSEIKGLLEQAGNADLSSTALILRIARLDLLTRINNIDESELKAFSESLEAAARSGSATGQGFHA